MWKVIYFPLLILLVFTTVFPTKARSGLLETVKSNPEEATALCNHFRKLNKEGISANSKKAIKEIAKRRKISTMDAEILSIYVIGMNCPDIK